MSQTETLVKYVSQGKFEDLPAEVVSHAKRTIGDTIACGLGGRATPDVDLLIDMMREVGGVPEATVIGDKTKLSFMQAAQVNRVMTNQLDYDDDYMKVGHMTTVLVPVALAIGERFGASGRDLINAVVHGYEAIIRIRDAVDPSPEAYVRSFEVDAAIHFGVTVVAGKLLGLTAEQMGDAFGLTGFVRAWRTTRPDRPKKGMPRWMKITGGDITIPGIHGVLLARKGFLGDRQVLDQGRGYEIVAGSDRYDETKLTVGLGETYRMLRIGFKFFPACRYTCSALDATSELVAEHRIKVDDVEEVIVRGQRHLYTNFRIYEPEYMIQGQFSIPYVVTMALTGMPRTEWYTEETLNDPKLRVYQHKVRVEEDPVQTERFYRLYTAGTTVEIRMKDGRQFSKHVEYPRGEPENPFSEQDHVDKLNWMASRLGMKQSQTDELYQTLTQLEKLDSVSKLTRLLVP